MVARGLVDLGVRQLVVAGGETAGACVQALGVTLLRIGGQIDTGVPWCYAIEPPRSLASRNSLPPEGAGLAWGGPAQRPGRAPSFGLHLALKSGNFGSDDFFMKAFQSLSTAA